MALKCYLCNQTFTKSKTHKFVTHSEVYDFDFYYCKKHKSYFGSFEDDKYIEKFDKFYKEFWKKHTRQKKTLKQKLLVYLRELLPAPKVISQYLYLHKHLKNVTHILEVGGGKGENFYFYVKKNYKINVIEPDKYICSELNKFSNQKVAFAGLFENINLDKKFDLIYSSHSFEHFVNPKEFLKSVKKNMHTGSIIFIEIPNSLSYNNKKVHQLLKKTHDIHHFSPEGLKKLFLDENYEIIDLSTWQQKLAGNPSLVKRIFIQASTLLGRDSYYKKRSGDAIRIIAKLK